ncbi:MAG: hypothetical protein Q4D10_06230 [Bacteroidales bacterium]|nr:hypothetical protein [Bacteroidales bacterium]
MRRHGLRYYFAYLEITGVRLPFGVGDQMASARENIKILATAVVGMMGLMLLRCRLLFVTMAVVVVRYCGMYQNDQICKDA